MFGLLIHHKSQQSVKKFTYYGVEMPHAYSFDIYVGKTIVLQ